MILRVEETDKIRADVTTLSERMTGGESSIRSLEQRMGEFEKLQSTQANLIIDLQLQTEMLEDRSRRNNLRLRGLLEVMDLEDLE